MIMRPDDGPPDKDNDKSDQPRTVFMGTSRIQQAFDPALLDGTRFAPAYNGAIPASTLAQNEAHLEHYFDLDPNLKHVFFELFFWQFITLETYEVQPEFAQ